MSNSEELVNVPAETGVSAAINSDYEVKLFDSGGKSMVVSTQDEDYWIQRGFRRNKLDIGVDSGALYALFDAAKVAVKEYVSGCVKDGVIDPSDTAGYYTAGIAMSKLAEMYTQLMADIAQVYPMKDTGVTVNLSKVKSDGSIESITVDASQVDLYTTEHGYSIGEGK